MHATWKVDENIWNLVFELDPEDPTDGRGQGTMTVGLLAREARFIFPKKIKQPHPDLMALAALVAIRPWIGNRLRLDMPVTSEFAACAKKLFGIDVTPVSNDLAPRTAGSTPLLSFSGGVDSVAASAVLPVGTPHIHFRRIDHLSIPNRAPHVRADAIEDVVVESGRRGRNVTIVQSDLEHICTPYPTLPHWFAITIGALLSADHFDGGSIVMGGTLETFYMDMGKYWRGEGGKGLEPLSELVGLPFMRPMLGVTEIGTMRISAASGLGDIARSCVLGSREAACGVCAKCVRKNLTNLIVQGVTRLPVSLANLAPTTPGLKSLEGDPPFYMQAQLAFTLSRLQLPIGGPFSSLYQRIGSPAAERTEWMNYYYSEAATRSIPEPWREAVVTSIEKFLPRMPQEQLDLAKSWDCR